MLLKPRNLVKQGFLVTTLVAVLGALGIAQAAEVSGAAAGAGAQLPKTPTVPLSAPTPAQPMSMPAAATPAPMAPKAAPTTAPAAVTATTHIAGNPDGSCPESAPVKVSKSKIYHVPEGRNYAKTKAKYCFANAAAAEQAGFRAPKK